MEGRAEGRKYRETGGETGGPGISLGGEVTTAIGRLSPPRSRCGVAMADAVETVLAEAALPNSSEVRAGVRTRAKGRLHTKTAQAPS